MCLVESLYSCDQRVFAYISHIWHMIYAVQTAQHMVLLKCACALCMGAQIYSMHSIPEHQVHWWFDLWVVGRVNKESIVVAVANISVQNISPPPHAYYDTIVFATNFCRATEHMYCSTQQRTLVLQECYDFVCYYWCNRTMPSWTFFYGCYSISFCIIIISQNSGFSTVLHILVC